MMEVEHLFPYKLYKLRITFARQLNVKLEQNYSPQFLDLTTSKFSNINSIKFVREKIFVT